MPILINENGKIEIRFCRDCIYYLSDGDCAKYGWLDDYCKDWEENALHKRIQEHRKIKKVLK